MTDFKTTPRSPEADDTVHDLPRLTGLTASACVEESPALMFLCWTTDKTPALTASSEGVRQVFQRSPLQDDALLAAHRRALEGQAYAGEIQRCGRRLQVQLQPLRDEANVIVGVTGLAFDLSSGFRPRQQGGVGERLLGLTAEVGELLSCGHSLSEILGRCTGSLVRWLGVASARIWTLERGEQVLLLQGSAGDNARLDSRYSRIGVGRLKIGQVAQSGHPYLTNELTHDARAEDRDWARRECFSSLAAHPLIADGRIVGVLAVLGNTPLPPTTLDELGAVADAIAQFVECQRLERARAVLLEREREARSKAEEGARRAAFLARTSLVLDSSVDQRSALEQMASLLLPAQANWCLIDLVEQGGVICRFTAGVGRDSDQVRLPPDSLYSPLFKLVMQTGEPVLFPDCSKVAPLLGDPVDPEDVRDSRSLLAVPLCARGRQFGVLVLVSTTPERRYSDADLGLVGDFAQRCSLTLDTLRLIEQTQREVAERRWAEEALLRSEEHLRQAEKMGAVGRLAAGIAHDFNNMMTAVMGYAEILCQALPSRSAEREMADAIREAGTRTTALTRQLLTFSRKRTSRPTPVNLNELLAGLEGLLRNSLRANIELSLEPADDLNLVFLDGGQFEQVVLNLAINARDAMPQGGRLTLTTRNIDLQATWAHPDVPSGSHVLLEVSDNGSGISDDVRAHLFEPFYTTKPMGQGTGLGLALAYEIVHQAGGFIEVDSQLGKGTCFQIYLPVAHVVSTEPTDRIEELLTAPVPRPTLLAPVPTVLVAEDDEVIRDLVTRALRSVGYSVIEAKNGRDALKLAGEARQLDLLVTDVIMPGMNGRDLAERLREERPELEVLYLSAYAENAVVQAIVGAGGTFLEKPFRLDALLDTVRRVLRH